MEIDPGEKIWSGYNQGPVVMKDFAKILRRRAARSQRPPGVLGAPHEHEGVGWVVMLKRKQVFQKSGILKSLPPRQSTGAAQHGSWATPLGAHWTLAGPWLRKNVPPRRRRDSSVVF